MSSKPGAGQSDLPNDEFHKNFKSDEFHKWVGYSITAWAKVEEWLFELCWRSLGSSKERAAIVYFKTPSLDARISLTDELVRTILPKPERKHGGHPHEDVTEWANLLKKVKGFLSTRNRIAHHPVQAKKAIVESLSDSPNTTNDLLEISWLELYASENERLRGKSHKPMPLFKDDVRAHSILVKGLADEVMHFYLHVFLKHLGKSRI